MSELKESNFSFEWDHSVLSREVLAHKGCSGCRCILLETHAEFSYLSVLVPDAPLLSTLACHSEAYFSLQSKLIPFFSCNDNQSDCLIPGSDQEICALHRSLRCKYWFTVFFFFLNLEIESFYSENRVLYVLLIIFPKRQWIVGNFVRNNWRSIMI